MILTNLGLFKNFDIEINNVNMLLCYSILHLLLRDL